MRRPELPARFWIGSSDHSRHKGWDGNIPASATPLPAAVVVSAHFTSIAASIFGCVSPPWSTVVITDSTAWLAGDEAFAAAYCTSESATPMAGTASFGGSA